MRIPVVKGIIDRRILVNYRVDADVMSRVLPAPFRPKLIGGYSIGGICLIRLKQVRPRFLPVPWGIGSENAAHRIAVEWEANGQTMEGVYIPRRDTDSRMNALVGGRVFPGVHHHAKFDVQETEKRLSVSIRSDDGVASMSVTAPVSESFPDGSVFGTLKETSDFFESGSLGYSATRDEGRFDGLELLCHNWSVECLDVEEVSSSFFEDDSIFPDGSVSFDCALLMRGIEHEWHGREDLCCRSA
ncbi:MAG: DUF2071 domain-containing protein [Planctomycetaceae bacterium]|nr:DUF2071 domain-containing protein [Planctomycetaceae bacterium]